MQWQSTQQQIKPVNTSVALQQGLAADGGLFMPTSIPHLDWKAFSPELAYPHFASHCLAPFFKGSSLAEKLLDICLTAFTIPVNLTAHTHNITLLELFHGPTLAFKDFGARFLAECLTQLTLPKPETLIMVATSGDTGSAVASAFYQKPNVKVVVLYPEGQITAHQEAQITCWGDNIVALAIDGNFDDCQRLVKTAFNTPAFTQPWRLSTANSINIGRLLPQIVYFAYASVQLAAKGIHLPTVVVPSGNLGHVTAAHMAKAMGFPLGDIIAVTNANRTLFEYIETGNYTPRQSVRTLANAMDVGNPSNFARLQALYPTFDAFKQHVPVHIIDDARIEETIKHYYEQTNDFICPHSATALSIAWENAASDNCSHQLVACTAHPCKFESVINAMLPSPVPLHPNLSEMLARAHPRVTIAPSLDAVMAHL